MSLTKRYMRSVNQFQKLLSEIDTVSDQEIPRIAKEFVSACENIYFCQEKIREISGVPPSIIGPIFEYKETSKSKILENPDDFQNYRNDIKKLINACLAHLVMSYGQKTHADEKADQSTRVKILISGSLLSLLDNLNEQVLSINSYSDDERQRKLEAIETVKKLIFEVFENDRLGAISSNDDTKSWLSRFKYALEVRFSEEFSPENAADAVLGAVNRALPLTIILTGAALGSVFGGSIGMGVGAFVAKSIADSNQKRSVDERILSLINENTED